MAPQSYTSSEPDPWAILEGQIRECYGRVVYSHKTHEKNADILLARRSALKIAQIVLSALTMGGFLIVVFGQSQIGSLLGIIMSTTLLALNAYTKKYDLGGLAQRHRQTGADLWFIREKYLSLITDIRMQLKPIETLRMEQDDLLEQLHVIYSGAPSTSSKAYQKAQVSLKESEDLTFSDKEIDAFLPTELKKG